MSATDLRPGQFPIATVGGKLIYPDLDMLLWMTRKDELTGGLDSTTSTTSAATTVIPQPVACAHEPVVSPEPVAAVSSVEIIIEAV